MLEYQYSMLLTAKPIIISKEMSRKISFLFPLNQHQILAAVKIISAPVWRNKFLLFSVTKYSTGELIQNQALQIQPALV